MINIFHKNGQGVQILIRFNISTMHGPLSKPFEQALMNNYCSLNAFATILQWLSFNFVITTYTVSQTRRNSSII